MMIGSNYIDPCGISHTGNAYLGKEASELTPRRKQTKSTPKSVLLNLYKCSLAPANITACICIYLIYASYVYLIY